MPYEGTCESVPSVEADSEALTHALWNLLDNAVKYSPERRTVWVDVGRQGAGVSIAVRDQGFCSLLHTFSRRFDEGPYTKRCFNENKLFNPTMTSSFLGV